MTMNKLTSRRQVLRGMMGGMAVSVGLPFLDCFLNTNGTALANGAPLPTVFGSWFQNLGFNPGRWKPETTGTGFRNNIELQPLDPFLDRMNIISGCDYYLDGWPMQTHRNGPQIASMGSIPRDGYTEPSFDTRIADVIGTTTRFKSIEVSLDGERRSLSWRAGGANNPSEPSPAALYSRLFGPDFTDPNNATFTPDPSVMARHSVLSAVMDKRNAVMKSIGSSDRERLDQYFDSIRQLEHQLAMQLKEPTPLASCRMPLSVEEAEVGNATEAVTRNNSLFSSLMAHAFACDQTRVLNVHFGTQGLRTPGGVRDWHFLTHSEPIDPELGYQREVGWFINFATKTFADFLHVLDSYREGDGTLLDRTLILWQTDHGYARTHTMTDLPIITVGDGGGRIRTGMHIAKAGDPTTRVGLTIQQVLGVSIGTWGELSNKTSEPLTELLA